jgi:leucine dehydrogenase
VAIQDAGGVGRWLAKILAEQGAELAVSDTQPASLETLADSVSFKEVGTEEIYAASDSLFCPCAIGGVLNPATVDRLEARIVAGSANNVLSQPEIGGMLHERGVAYAPDYLVNAGALIQGVRFLQSGERASNDAIRTIGVQTRSLLESAQQLGVPPETILEKQTQERLGLRRSWRQWCWPARHSE